MSERFAQYDGGKGPEDRSNVNKRQDCPLWKQVKLSSGVHLTPEEAKHAIEDAYELMQVLECKVMTQEINRTLNRWCENYFPKYD